MQSPAPLNVAWKDDRLQLDLAAGPRPDADALVGEVVATLRKDIAAAVAVRPAAAKFRRLTAARAKLIADRDSAADAKDRAEAALDLAIDYADLGGINAAQQRITAAETIIAAANKTLASLDAPLRSSAEEVQEYARTDATTALKSRIAEAVARRDELRAVAQKALTKLLPDLAAAAAQAAVWEASLIPPLGVPRPTESAARRAIEDLLAG